MPLYCKACAERRHGTMCKKWCREKYGDMGAEQIPRLGGMLFINYDGTGTPRLEQRIYDESMCRRGVAPPHVIQGPRPSGWNEALCRIGERAAKTIQEGIDRGVKLPCGED